MSNPETKTIKIFFVKKNETDVPKIKLTYFNSTTQKNEDLILYDFFNILTSLALNGMKLILG